VDLPAGRLPEIAVVGRSNVGKSSAINTLLGRKSAARVSGTPGRTRAVNLFEVDSWLSVADLPGYGFARVSQTLRDSWAPMASRYIARRDTLRLVVVLVDSRRDAQPLDLALLDQLGAAARPALVVATKVDKIKPARRVRTLAALGAGLGLAGPPIGFSALKKIGVPQVWKAICRACER